MPKLFNFSCYAVLSVDNLDDPESDPDNPQLRGFWPDKASADAAAVAMEAERLTAHTQRWRGYGFPHYAPSITRYAVIPLTDVEQPDFWHLEDALEAAAKLQLQGIGKLPSASVAAEEAALETAVSQ